MRPLLSSLVATTLLVGSVGQTLAQSQPCMRGAEKAAFDLAAIKSELMVIAIDCQAQERYNAFVVRFRPDLQGSERGLNTYFSRTARTGTARAHDDYITSLANALSQDALTRGTLFCDEHMRMFDDVLALKDGRDLLSYASGKGLVQPIDLVECPAPPRPAVKKKPAVAKPVALKTETVKTAVTQ
jgi:hypothetical protein